MPASPFHPQLGSQIVEIGFHREELLFESTQISKNSIAVFRLQFGIFRFIQLRVHFLHAVHDDADKEIEHDHGSQQDEADEVD